MMPRDIEKVFLSRFTFKHHLNIDVNKVIFDGNSPEVNAVYLADEMLVTLAKKIYGQKIITNVVKEVMVPATWFDHLKKSAGLTYKESPIKVEIDLDVYALFPHLEDTKSVIEFKADVR